MTVWATLVVLLELVLMGKRTIVAHACLALKRQSLRERKSVVTLTTAMVSLAVLEAPAMIS